MAGVRRHRLRRVCRPDGGADAARRYHRGGQVGKRVPGGGGAHNWPPSFSFFVVPQGPVEGMGRRRARGRCPPAWHAWPRRGGTPGKRATPTPVSPSGAALAAAHGGAVHSPQWGLPPPRGRPQSTLVRPAAGGREKRGRPSRRPTCGGPAPPATRAPIPPRATTPSKSTNHRVGWPVGERTRASAAAPPQWPQPRRRPRGRLRRGGGRRRATPPPPVRAAVTAHRGQAVHPMRTRSLAHCLGEHAKKKRTVGGERSGCHTRMPASQAAAAAAASSSASRSAAKEKGSNLTASP